MFVDKPLVGETVELRACDARDAEFTLSLRNDPRMAGFIPPLDISIDEQKKWIRMQREKAGDYFFIIWDKKLGKRIGTISVYDIDGDTAE